MKQIKTRKYKRKTRKYKGGNIKKNICIGFHGQLRTFIKNAEKLKSQIINNDNNKNYIVLLSTWKTENIEDFQKIFPNSIIKQFDEETEKKIKWDKKSKLNITNNHKNILNYWKYQKSLENLGFLINEYENTNNIEFNLILRIRADITISDNIFPFYDKVESNKIYVASDPKYNIYNKGAYPDFLAFGKNKEMKNILNGIHFIEKVLHEPHVFHPETSMFGIIKYFKYDVIYIPITVSKLL